MKPFVLPRIPNFQFIWWPFIQSVRTESADGDDAKGWTFTVWQPYFFRRHLGHEKYKSRIWFTYHWVVVIGYLEIRRWRFTDSDRRFLDRYRRKS